MRQLLIIQVHLTVEPDENVNVLGQAFIAAVKVMLGTSKSVLRHVSLRLAIWGFQFFANADRGRNQVLALVVAPFHGDPD